MRKFVMRVIIYLWFIKKCDYKVRWKLKRIYACNCYAYLKWVILLCGFIILQNFVMQVYNYAEFCYVGLKVIRKFCYSPKMHKTWSLEPMVRMMALYLNEFRPSAWNYHGALKDLFLRVWGHHYLYTTWVWMPCSLRG